MNHHLPRVRHAFAGTLAAVALCVAWGRAGAQTVKFDPIHDVRLEQKLDSQVPLDLPFRDESGKEIKLGDYFGKKPVMLVMPFYQCKGSCTVELNAMVKLFKRLPFTPGEEFEAVTLSINPKEGPELAKEKKLSYMQMYGKDEAAKGWHFLTGSQDSIQQLAKAVGFHYVYDVATDQYSHPAGIMIITPQGKMSRYFMKIPFNANEVRLSLIEASEAKIGTLTDQVLLACTNYDPRTGHRSLKIMRIYQAGGILTVLLLGSFIFLMFRRDNNTTPLAPIKKSDPGSVTST